MKILIFSHAHPELSRGGAEIAAFAHFEALKAAGHTCVFVACSPPAAIGHDARFGAFRGRGDEILWVGAELDHFRLATVDPSVADEDLSALLDRHRPDIVHFHHYFGFGVDTLASAAALSGASVFLTLHEYGAICHNYGQMIKTNDRLCYVASGAECSACFPDLGAGKFFLRREKLLRHMSAIAGFVSPSRFLADRYVAWGLPTERMHVVENILPASTRRVAPSGPNARGGTAPAYSESRPLRLGYFGQFTRFKGVHVLLQAVHALSPEQRACVRIDLFGSANGEMNKAYIESQMPTVEALAPTVHFQGAYRNEDVVRLLRLLDWLVMPSVWWENAPVILQEARVAGVPVLTSDIGGMAEKVEPGVHGDHFLTGNAADLASKIARVLSGDLRVIPPAFDPAAANAERLERLIELYQGGGRHLAPVDARKLTPDAAARPKRTRSSEAKA